MREQFIESADVTTIGYSSYQTRELLADPIVKRVCVDSQYVQSARFAGKTTSVVVGFPFGTATYGDIRQAILDGTHEIDFPIPVELVAGADFYRPGISAPQQKLANWLDTLTIPAHPDITYKVILHTDLAQKIWGKDALSVIKSLAETVKFSLDRIYRQGNLVMKTCTGYGPGKVDPQIVEALVSEGYRVKASGGIRTVDDVGALFQAGASLLGIGYSSFKDILGTIGEENVGQRET